tara:strand:- start:319 stop:1863 length:1545 start_codon:yes stop_codon:yes gene_type:complete
MTSQAQRFMNLFAGMKEAYGCYIISDEKEVKGKKREGRGITKRDPLTIELWEKHFKGTDNLGVIPIRRDNTCFWGAIDIDEYDLDLKTLAIRIYSQKIPLFPMRSKSGGCHLVALLSEPVAARTLQDKLAEIAAGLGYGKCEIFPKQSTVMVEKGDLGNWLNMPYFGGDNSARYCLDQHGEAMSSALFLAAAERGRLTEKQLNAIKIDMGKKGKDLEDGPPCLQSLVSQGFPQGTRNNGLFALGVYCRKAFGDDWQNQLAKYNDKYMDPPLPVKEVQIVTKQVDKKDYNYKCRDQPLCNFCNAALCRTRQYGIGSGSMPSLSALRKIPTDQPVWFLQINDQTVELTTDDIHIQAKFQKVCIDTMNVFPPKVSEQQWQSIIQPLLTNCKILEKPAEAGLADQFSDLLWVFCTDARIKANTREEILLGRPWHSTHPDDETIPRVYFRLKDLVDFMVRNGFRHYTRSQMISKIQSENIGGKPHFLNIKGKGCNMWHVPQPDEQDSGYELPEMRGDVL